MLQFRFLAAQETNCNGYETADTMSHVIFPKRKAIRKRQFGVAFIVDRKMLPTSNLCTEDCMGFTSKNILAPTEEKVDDVKE